MLRDRRRRRRRGGDGESIRWRAIKMETKGRKSNSFLGRGSGK